MSGEIWTIKQAARELNLSANGVRWLIAQGKLSCQTTTGGLRLFDASVVKELAQERAASKSQPKQAA